MKIRFYKTVLCILFFAFTTNNNAQTVASVEKLQEEIRRHPQRDTFRINRLNELSWRSDIRSSLRDSLITKTLQLSQQTGYAAGAAIALTIKSLNVEMSQATVAAKQAIAMADKSGDKSAIFWAYRALGTAMLNTSDGINALHLFQQALRVAERTRNSKLIIFGQLAFVDYYKTVQINYPLALQWSLKALQTAEQTGNKEQLGLVYRNIGLVYLLIDDQEKSLANMQKALQASREAGDKQTEEFTLNDIGERYRITGKYPEAMQAYTEAGKLINDPFNIELNQSNIADAYQRMGNDALCFKYAFTSLAGAGKLKDTIGIAWIDEILSRAYLHSGKIDSAIFYGLQGFNYSVQTRQLEFKRDNSEALANAYNAKKDYARAFNYYKIFISSRDSMINQEITNKSKLAQYNYDLEKKQSEIVVLNKDKQLQKAQAQRQTYLLVAALLVLALVITILLLLYRSSRLNRKAYIQLQKQKQEIQIQQEQTHLALTELKSTQSQLIQSEKMASLGELTAGIAHEIQNPLNFVNNFSEVNTELIEELEGEKSKVNGERDEQLEMELLADIKENEQKINFHGKRADAIVKGMLQHSRQTKGVKEPTDINALCDEYLRLSYHGLHAKDKNFNADFKTDFDEAIGKVNIVPQDIGRVLLNLYNNAFYAVNERQKAEGERYKPEVSVKTKRFIDKIEVQVLDNGNGIPQNIIDKIFQPFFTTKPTGEGTGLGLSLAYDIITKVHNGSIKVESKEGEGSAFIINLP